MDFSLFAGRQSIMCCWRLTSRHWHDCMDSKLVDKPSTGMCRIDQEQDSDGI